MLLLSFADSFKTDFFKQFFQKHYQSIQIKTVILSVLIWVQAVFKGYQQKTKGAANQKKISCFCCHLLTLFRNWFFQTIPYETLSEYQTVWIQIKTIILWVLIWVQTICKGYQQITKNSTRKGRVNWASIYMYYFVWAAVAQVRLGKGPGSSESL